MINDILPFPRLYGAAVRRAVVQRSSEEELTVEKNKLGRFKFQRSVRRTSKHHYLGSEQTVYTVDVEVKCGHAVQLCAQLCTSTQVQIESLWAFVTHLGKRRHDGGCSSGSKHGF